VQQAPLACRYRISRAIDGKPTLVEQRQRRRGEPLFALRSDARNGDAIIEAFLHKRRARMYRHVTITAIVGAMVFTITATAAEQMTPEQRRAEYQRRYDALTPDEKRRIDNINRQIRELREQRHQTLYPPQRSPIRR
jgi:hypothetical protein